MISTATSSTSSVTNPGFTAEMYALSKCYTESSEQISDTITTLQSIDKQNPIKILCTTKRIINHLLYTKWRLKELNGSYYEDPRSLLHRLSQQGAVGEKKFKKACAERDTLQRQLKEIEPLLNAEDKIYDTQDMATIIAINSDLQPVLSQMLPRLQAEHQGVLDCATFVQTLILWHAKESDSIELKIASTKIVVYFLKQKTKIDSVSFCNWNTDCYFDNIDLNQCSLSKAQIVKVSNLIKKFISDDSFKKPKDFKEYILNKLAKQKPHAGIFPNAEKPISLDPANQNATPQKDYFFYMTSLPNEVIKEIFLRCVSADDSKGLMQLAMTCKWFYREIIGPKSAGQGFIEELNLSNWCRCRLPHLHISMDKEIPSDLLDKESATIHKPTLMHAYKVFSLHPDFKTLQPFMLIIKIRKNFFSKFLEKQLAFSIKATTQGCYLASKSKKPQFLYWPDAFNIRMYLLIPTQLYSSLPTG
jgi:hypothetical protein